MANKVTEEQKASFWVRFISSIVLVILTVTLIVVGSYPLAVGTFVISVIGFMELMRAAGIHKTPMTWIGYLAITALYAAIVFDKKEFLLPIFILYLICIFGVMVLTYPKYTVEKTFFAFTGFIYVAFGLSFIFQTRMDMPKGNLIVWLIFLSAWGSDTMAYCTGLLFGKHKAFPVLSPKKSVEGCIGGVVGGALFGCIFNAIVVYGMGIEFLEMWEIIVICACASAISQIGDLAASAIKRFFSIKDYGNIIPGHGGIMDRFDSIIFVAPVVYYLSFFIFG